MPVHQNGVFSRWTTGIASNVSHPKKGIKFSHRTNAMRAAPLRSILVCQAPTYSKKLEKDQIDHFALRDLYAYICSMVKIESQESTYAKPSPQLHPDEEAGEIPVACVVRKAGSKVEEDDIFTFMENKVEGETFF
ncbi:hypothetical protein BHE74_00004308 [Ensete ventricosum]|nr:hypothetical protein BHE74_00004308 [Ensete ventricosum]